MLVFRKKWGLIFSISAMVGSVLVNVLLFVTVITLFEKLQYSRIFPLGYIPSNSINLKIYGGNESGKSRLFFLGDSRASMWNSRPLQNKYEVVNLAHGGQTSAQVLLQVKTSTVPKQSWVILQVGINDMHSIGAFTESKQFILNNIKKNISQIVDQLVAQNNHVIVTSLFPPAAPPLERLLFWDNNSLALIAEINAYIKMKCNEPLVYFLDSYELLRSSNGALKKEYRDEDFFLHVNSSAYFLLNDEVLRLIELDH